METNVVKEIGKIEKCNSIYLIKRFKCIIHHKLENLPATKRQLRSKEEKKKPSVTYVARTNAPHEA